MRIRIGLRRSKRFGKIRLGGKRLGITGGSAGGYVVLCAITFYKLFSAAASYFGISDLEALEKDTHKFESCYSDTLVGPVGCK
jgi:dipeptidyl aminopeptidase/acylaminoacyl peptidase